MTDDGHDDNDNDPYYPEASENQPTEPPTPRSLQLHKHAKIFLLLPDDDIELSDDILKYRAY